MSDSVLPLVALLDWCAELTHSDFVLNLNRVAVTPAARRRHWSSEDAANGFHVTYVLRCTISAMLGEDIAARVLDDELWVLAGGHGVAIVVVVWVYPVPIHHESARSCLLETREQVAHGSPVRIARVLIGCRNCVKLALKYGGVKPLIGHKKRPISALSFNLKLSAL